MKLSKLKQHVENAKVCLLDFRDELFGLRGELIPPRRMIFVGGGDYKLVGEHFFGVFLKHGGLRPSDRVLDVGCGQGRIAVPLTRYLRDGGSYEGFDIVRAGIEWCTDKFTPRYPNFVFRHADIYNRYYNPDGRYKASEYVFPYPDDEFDFVFLTSVFTHMYPTDMERYLSEISRVLKPGRRCLITWFILNDESRSMMVNDKSSFNFYHPLEGCYTATPKEPEGAMAYDEVNVRDAYRRVGLHIEDIYYGSWPAREQYMSFQDIVVASCCDV